MNCLINMIGYALAAGIFTWGLTALGASAVIFVKKSNNSIMNLFLGFSAGVMLASSFWSLICPALEKADGALPSSIQVALGIFAGAGFMRLCDMIIGKRTNAIKKSNGKRCILSRLPQNIKLLFMSITLHNIPEGLAVGIAFGAVGIDENPSKALICAFTVAIGIGIQNFPEGAAVSLPLKNAGFSRERAWFYGQLSAAVEPIFAVIGAIAVSKSEFILPFSLSFAAGAMILVIVHEIIPECNGKQTENPYISTFGFISGFIIMMLLDTLL